MNKFSFLHPEFLKGKVRKGKLIYEYIIVLIVVACVAAASFLATSYIVNFSVMEQSRQSSEVIFQQAQEQIGVFEDDIDSLYTNLVRNLSVEAFFKAEDFTGRWKNLNGFYQVVGNNMRINRNLQNTLLYDAEGSLIATKGGVFFPRQEEELQAGKATFSNCVRDKKTGAAYFEVGLPVYVKVEGLGFQPFGSVYLVFDVKNLQNIVNNALPNKNSAVAILDKSNHLVVSAGQWQEGYANHSQSGENRDFLFYVSPVGESGWRMISVIPKKSLLSGVTLMQQVTYLTYLVFLGVMAMTCWIIYKRIIQPISDQISFMTNFTKDTGQRIEVKSNNEIGEMALKMNEMLDDIETLNSEIIDSQKRYLELEYAKKQTEMIAYKSQINPHFLSNTFNCIRGMALFHGEKEIADLTMSLSAFFRYSVRGDEMVTVKEALENLQHYAKIIQYRFNGKHRILVEASRDLFLIKIPKMLIQPLVENAVLHGMETKVEGGAVHVEICMGKEEKLSVSILDNGCGMNAETLERLQKAMEYYDREDAIPEGKYGIGFLNVYRRLRLFYGKDADFSLNSCAGEGTEIRMLLPARRKNEPFLD